MIERENIHTNTNLITNIIINIIIIITLPLLLRYPLHHHPLLDHVLEVDQNIK